MACIYLWNDSCGGGSAMTSNNVLLAVKWPVFYLRDFVRLFGREMAFIYLWNDSSGGASATTSNNVFFGHEMACILFVRLFGREMACI